MNMRKSSKRVLELLKRGETLIQARLNAINTSKEIQGFGNISISSPLSLSSSSLSSMLPDSPESSRSSICNPNSATNSNSGDSNLAWSEDNQLAYNECDDDDDDPSQPSSAGRGDVGESSSYSIEVEEDERKGEGKEKEKGKQSGSFVDGLCSKLGISPKGSS